MCQAIIRIAQKYYRVIRDLVRFGASGPVSGNILRFIGIFGDHLVVDEELAILSKFKFFRSH